MSEALARDPQPSLFRSRRSGQDPTRRTTDASPRMVRRKVPPRAIPFARALVLLEAVLPLAVLCAFVLMFNLREMPSGLNAFLAMRITVKNIVLGGAHVIVTGLALIACRAYVLSKTRRFRDELIRVGLAVTFSMALALVFPLTSVGGAVHWSHVHAAWAAVLALELVIRGLRRVSLYRGKRVVRRVLVVGLGVESLESWREAIADDYVNSYQLVGFVDGQPFASGDERRLGGIGDVERVLMQKTVDEVFVALPIATHYHDFEHVIAVCERVGIKTKYSADIVPTTVAWPRLERGSRSIVTMNVAPDDYRMIVKRMVDIIGGAAALIVLSPVMAAAALAVKLTSPGPVFFMQERCGLNRRPFKMIKFRTMVANATELQRTLEAKNEAVGPVFKIASDPRITAVGRFLRKTSIDELPQLFNVLRGEMSLVGPRPLPMRDVKRFRRGTDMRRFSVTPGLTCLWQVNGRSSVGFGEWVQLDLQYIDDWSLQQDLQILVRTVPAVIRGDGAM
jgi:exopolysaccharide biosynthesis polyprenyl glycosylphosphotransferase